MLLLGCIMDPKIQGWHIFSGRILVVCQSTWSPDLSLYALQLSESPLIHNIFSVDCNPFVPQSSRRIRYGTFIKQLNPIIDVSIQNTHSWIVLILTYPFALFVDHETFFVVCRPPYVTSFTVKPLNGWTNLQISYYWWFLPTNPTRFMILLDSLSSTNCSGRTLSLTRPTLSSGIALMNLYHFFLLALLA